MRILRIREKKIYLIKEKKNKFIFCMSFTYAITETKGKKCQIFLDSNERMHIDKKAHVPTRYCKTRNFASKGKKGELEMQNVADLSGTTSGSSISISSPRIPFKYMDTFTPIGAAHDVSEIAVKSPN